MEGDTPRKVCVSDGMTQKEWVNFIWEVFPKLAGKPFVTLTQSRNKKLNLVEPVVTEKLRSERYQGVVFVQEVVCIHMALSI